MKETKHPSTVALESLVQQLEMELGTLQAQFQPLRDEYDELARQIGPLEGRQRVLESMMDNFKPRIRELSEQLLHLRKAVPVENKPARIVDVEINT